jgi:hypothetical protein
MRPQIVSVAVLVSASALACAHNSPASAPHKSSSKTVVRPGRGDQGPSVVTCQIPEVWTDPTRPEIDAWVETDCVTKRGLTIEIYEPAASKVWRSDRERVLHPGGESLMTPPFNKPTSGTTVRVRLTATCVNGDDAGGTGDCVMP